MIHPYARTAFVGGYAEAGEDAFPIPPHAQAAMHAAVEAASENDDPTVLDAVRASGRRTGLRAALDRRRDALESRWRKKLAPVLRQVAQAAGPHIARMVLKLEAAPSQDQRKQIAAAISKLQGTAIGGAWLAVIRDAIVEGTAEGRAIASAYLAESRGAVIPDFAIEFAQQLDALRNLGDLPSFSDPESWLTKTVDGMTYDLGRALADAQESGADYQTMLGIVEDAMTDEESDAYLWLDQAIGVSATAGSMALYGEEGVDLVDFLTSPNACETCEDIERDNPYPLNDCPEPPGDTHYNCRCAVAPH